MKIQYRDRKLRQLCEERASAEAKLGAPCAAKLRLRLAALEAAIRVSDLVAGSPHPLKGAYLNCMSLTLAGGSRIVFASGHDPCPTHSDGSVDWSKVTVVRIEYLGNYHV